MILVPVKNLNGAKQRLSAVLDQPRRTQLARAMLEDVLEALASCPGQPPVAVVTSDEFAVEAARRFRCEIIPDTENGGETAAIEMATAVCAARGAEFTFVLPGDIPLLRSEEVAHVFATAPSSGSVLVRASDQRGTNGALRRPCALFPLRFGNDSFLPHHAAAQATGLPCVVLELPGIGLDIDRPEDLDALLAEPTRTRTQRLLRAWRTPDHNALRRYA